MAVNHFDILPSMPGSSKWSSSFRFPHQNPECISFLPHTCHTHSNTSCTSSGSVKSRFLCTYISLCYVSHILNASRSAQSTHCPRLTHTAGPTAVSWVLTPTTALSGVLFYSRIVRSTLVLPSGQIAL